MQIKDRDFDYSSEPESPVEDSKLLRMTRGFRLGLGFAPTSIDEDETMTAPIDFGPEPEDLEEKDRVGDDTWPSRQSSAG